MVNGHWILKEEKRKFFKDRGNLPSSSFHAYTIESTPLLLGDQLIFQSETLLLASTRRAGRPEAPAGRRGTSEFIFSSLIGKDSDAGRDGGQEEKGKTQDEMAGWHHGLDGRES